ncbi:hypothetical protein [Streptomyces acidicola]|uniref:hypothetical protein n=1 Tax=Streptomyces acidicola TaxID=2596892 RepID=UPI0037F5DC3A
MLLTLSSAQRMCLPHTTVLNLPAREALGAELRPGPTDHPWTGWSFSVGWGSWQQLQVQLVEPDVVAKVAVDVSMDKAGLWRHPVRLRRVRTDLTPAEIQLFGERH